MFFTVLCCSTVLCCDILVFCINLYWEVMSFWMKVSVHWNAKMCFCIDTWNGETFHVCLWVTVCACVFVCVSVCVRIFLDIRTLYAGWRISVSTYEYYSGTFMIITWCHVRVPTGFSSSDEGHNGTKEAFPSSVIFKIPAGDNFLPHSSLL